MPAAAASDLCESKNIAGAIFYLSATAIVREWHDRLWSNRISRRPEPIDRIAPICDVPSNRTSSRTRTFVGAQLRRSSVSLDGETGMLSGSAGSHSIEV